MASSAFFSLGAFASTLDAWILQTASQSVCTASPNCRSWASRIHPDSWRSALSLVIFHQRHTTLKLTAYGTAGSAPFQNAPAAFFDFSLPRPILAYQNALLGQSPTALCGSRYRRDLIEHSQLRFGRSAPWNTRPLRNVCDLTPFAMQLKCRLGC